MKWLFAQDLADAPTQWHQKLLALTLRVGVVLGAIVYVPSVLAAWRAGLFGLVALDTIVLGAVMALYLGKQWPTRVRATAFCLIVYVLSVGLLMTAGSISQIYLFGFSILATLLLGLRAGLYASGLSALTLLFLGAAGLAAEGMAHPNIAEPLLGWTVISLNFALVNFLLTLAVGLVISALNHALEREVGARQTLERERAFLRTLIDAIPDLIYTKDLSGRYVIGNQATLTRFKLEVESQLAGKTVFDMLPPELATAINAQDLEVVAGRPILNHEGLSVDAEGKPAWYQTIKVPLRDTQGEITGIVCVGRDITERKNLEALLRQSQKMEAVGRLAGGVAHDFNNMLTVISGYSEQLLESPGLDARTRNAVLAISQASDRAATLTRQLLGFSRQTILQPQVTDLNAVVTQTSSMLRRLIGEDIALKTVMAPDIATVMVDPGQLDQVLLNLAVNARDAMPTGGRLTIETANVQLGDDYVAAHLDCKPGPHVMLAITDSGVGMTPEVLGRIFEPFFTTKTVGAGTGLGLAMVFGIVQQSGGCIHVYSEPAHGTTFKIYFPAVGRKLAPPRGAETPAPVRGTETVLLVEDEEGVRALALASLTRHGYHVIAAVDGHDALQTLQAHDGSIQLIVTDVVMPRMSGPALAQAALTRWPKLKVLFMSGYTDDAVVRHGLLQGEVSFIQKPFTPAGLALKVRQVLDQV